MSYVKIDFAEALYVVEADTESMATIGFFLADDVHYGGGADRIEWILDDRYDITSSNRTFMEKYDGKIGVGDLFTEDPNEAALSVPTAVMIDLLKQWDEVCKANPEAVIIHYENEKFRIEIKKNDHNVKEDSSVGKKVLK
jgi:hypothetical protein